MSHKFCICNPYAEIGPVPRQPNCPVCGVNAVSESAPTIPRWQPFATAPRDGSHFVAATRFMDIPVVEVIWWADGRWQGAHGEWRFDAWMPSDELLKLPMPVAWPNVIADTEV